MSLYFFFVEFESDVVGPGLILFQCNSRVLYSDNRQEDKNGHSYVKLDEDIVKR